MKLEQTRSGGNLTNTNKKPTKIPKTSTELQAIILVEAASAQTTPTICPTLRRSERLKEKAAVSDSVSAPPLTAAQSSGSSQYEKEDNPMKASRSSRRKKPKMQLHVLEAASKARHKCLKKHKKKMSAERPSPVRATPHAPVLPENLEQLGQKRRDTPHSTLESPQQPKQSKQKKPKAQPPALEAAQKARRKRLNKHKKKMSAEGPSPIQAPHHAPGPSQDLDQLG